MGKKKTWIFRLSGEISRIRDFKTGTVAGKPGHLGQIIITVLLCGDEMWKMNEIIGKSFELKVDVVSEMNL